VIWSLRETSSIGAQLAQISARPNDRCSGELEGTRAPTSIWLNIIAACASICDAISDGVRLNASWTITPTDAEGRKGPSMEYLTQARLCLLEVTRLLFRTPPDYTRNGISRTKPELWEESHSLPICRARSTRAAAPCI
jgi:hypothetical protein